MTDPQRHTFVEDLQGMSLGVFFCALGLTFLTHLGLITGQTAGIAVIISYLSGWSFGPVFFVINLPFYVLAWIRMGRAFTIKSLICVTALSVLTEVIPANLMFTDLSPLLGAITFGALTGVGLLALFRHNGSLGGLGIVALLVQDTTGFKAGYLQLAVDGVIFAAALLLFPATVVMWSLMGAVVLNLIITFNHRRDRYVAT
ncbi:YitT family protein [Loktanella sp. SALINAS62]|uniref:YitT family protein n=1 Tax=Loktanella sp. SALINAS62 TaxID=2706124 RepID=UPI001B8D94D1|nr:YitT family protein [Loktanella sp. SALINAS62]MBS1303735.1 YitT family protein [Loktanella sp. SALINAS62]